MIINVGSSLKATEIPDGQWAVRVRGITAEWRSDPYDRRKPLGGRPLPVMWRRWVQVLGVTAGELRVYLQDDKRGVRENGHVFIERKLRLVADKPFVAALIPDPYSRKNHNIGCDVFVARQVQNGIPTGRIEMPHLPVARSAMPSPDSRIGGELRWVNLGALQESTGISAVDIIQHYAPFSPSTVHSPNVPVARGSYSEIHDQDNLKITRLYVCDRLKERFGSKEEHVWGDDKNTLDGYMSAGQWSPDELWVPQQYASAFTLFDRFSYFPG